MWGCERSDEREKDIQLLIVKGDLQVINQPGNPPTCRGRAGVHSNIDVTLASANMAQPISEWNVADMVTSSDHNLIHMKMNVEALKEMKASYISKNII